MKRIRNKFSVIMPVYFREQPENLQLAIESLLGQSLVPDEIVVVLDGPVGKSLQKVIEKFKQLPSFKVLSLDSNRGVGIARKTAIQHAKYDVIALMDSDDISCEKRFEKQIEKIDEKKADVVGAWIEEFVHQPGDLGTIRKLPEHHEEIFKFGKWRMPVNNVTLMFTRRAYETAGCYTEQTKNEDWNLVVRMLTSGSKFLNIQNVLVYARAGQDMIIRRRGWTHQLTALYIFPLMFKLRYIGLFHATLNVVLRVLLRCLPLGATYFLYRKFLRSKE